MNKNQTFQSKLPSKPFLGLGKIAEKALVFAGKYYLEMVDSKYQQSEFSNGFLLENFFTGILLRKLLAH